MHRQATIERVTGLLAHADVQLDGDRPWDIQVRDERFFSRVPAEGSMGLGESYMDGWWDCEQLDELVYKILSARLDQHVRSDWRLATHLLMSRVLNLQNRRRSREVAEKHYHLDAELYMSFLDPYNQYTCAYFRNTGDLDQAQENKLELICRKLHLSSGDRVLDIGCGWGGFAKFAAERYGCQVTGVTISAGQAKYAREFCRGLDVQILESDYRDLTKRIPAGAFDKVLVCGMIEHVGYKNYRLLMKAVAHCLPDHGLLLLHTIGGLASGTMIEGNRWLTKYIFPNAMPPSLQHLTVAAEGVLIVKDLHNFGPQHYEKTLLAWWSNFDRSWDTIRPRYDERFYRMWRFYLLSVAGSFRAGRQHLWQIVLSKKGVGGEYEAVRW